jgi:hypothetical protein
MAKLIQICASQNDLFGLDGDGVVCKYNFNTNEWIELGDARADRSESARGDSARDEGRASAQPSSETPRRPRGPDAPVMRGRA